MQIIKARDVASSARAATAAADANFGPAWRLGQAGITVLRLTRKPETELKSDFGVGGSIRTVARWSGWPPLLLSCWPPDNDLSVERAI